MRRWRIGGHWSRGRELPSYELLPRAGHSWPLIVSTRRLYEREFEAWQTQIAARAATEGWHLVCLEWVLRRAGGD